MLPPMSSSAPSPGAPHERSSTPGFCRELCASEPLAGTANPEVIRWVLLEDGGPWGPKVPVDTALPQPVIEWLLARDAEPHTRVQLIRRPGSCPGSRRRLILAEAHAHADQRRLLELEVELDELPSLDLDSLLAAAPVRPTLADLWLVCTHGTRDRCCAKWGMPIFEALCQRDPDRVWQCSHLGGHRFAPTFLTLPGGLVWGRFDPARLDALAQSLAAGQLGELEQLRGRCCYPRAVQAAECLIRIRDEIADDAGLELVAHASAPDQPTQVEFRSATGDRLRVEVELSEVGFAAPASCGDAPERRTTLRLKPAVRTSS